MYILSEFVQKISFYGTNYSWKNPDWFKTKSYIFSRCPTYIKIEKVNEFRRRESGNFRI